MKVDYLKIIDDVQKIRYKNNKSWMDILRIAFKHAPDETLVVLKDILKHDKEINDCWADVLKEDK